MLVLNGKGGGVELQPHIHHHHHHLQLGGFHPAWLGGGGKGLTTIKQKAQIRSTMHIKLPH